MFGVEGVVEKELEHSTRQDMRNDGFHGSPASLARFRAKCDSIFQPEKASDVWIEVRTAKTSAKLYHWDYHRSSAVSTDVVKAQTPSDIFETETAVTYCEDRNDELDTALRATPVCFIIGHSSNSNSRLSPSRELFEELMRRYSISARFLDFVMCYGFKKYEFDFAPPAPKFRVLSTKGTGAGAEGSRAHAGFHGFECMYGIRYVARTAPRHQSRERWAVRQSTVYQKFDPVARKDICIMIGPCDDFKRCVDKYLETRQHTHDDWNRAARQALAAHVSLVETSMLDWRWYLADLSEKVREHADKVLLADVGDVDSDGGIMRVNFEDSQTLKLLEDAVLNLQVTLEGTQGTIVKLRKCLHGYAEQCVPQDAEAIETALIDLHEDTALHLMKAKVLLERVKGAASLLTDLLSYENGSALKDIAQESRKDNEQMRDLTLKATKDSEAIKVITIITVFFLPATVVASFFSTDFVRLSTNGDLKISGMTWIYFAVTVPLTAITIVIWYWGARGTFRPRVTNVDMDKHESTVTGNSSMVDKAEDRARPKTFALLRLGWRQRLSNLLDLRNRPSRRKRMRLDVEESLPTTEDKSPVSLVTGARKGLFQREAG